MGPRVGPAQNPEGVTTSTPLRRPSPTVVNRCCLGAGELPSPRHAGGDHVRQEGHPDHRSRPRHGRRHRPAPPSTPGTGSWPPHATPAVSPRHWAALTTSSRCRWTSPTHASVQARSTPPRSGSAASTCWSTTPATSTPGSSKRSPADDFRAQLETNLFGPLNVTRAVLPVMRASAPGLVVTITSTAGPGRSGVHAPPTPPRSSPSKAGSESLTPEIAPFGIRTMVVEPGFFRTDLLTADVDQLRRVHRSTTTPSARSRPSPPGAP